MKKFLITSLIVVALLSPAVYQVSGQASVENLTENMVLEESLNISFRITAEDPELPFHSVILRIKKGASHFLTLLLSSEGISPVSMYLIGNNAVYRNEIPAISTKNPQWAFSFSISSSDDLFTLSVADTVFHFYELGFARGNKYNLVILPDYSTNYNRSGDNLLNVTDALITAGIDNVRGSGSTELLLLLLLILADIALFLVIHYRNRYLKRRKGKVRAGQISVPNEELAKPEVSWISTVKLFGTFQVYTGEGEEISGSFSPTLKELFLLLLCHQSTGISSSRLKEILWFDKSEESARNNRSVYITKLRQLLDRLGDYEISSTSGNWKTDMKDIYVDYFHFNRIIGSTTIVENDISELITILRGGNLLSECNYTWLDDIKARAADHAITILTNYARHIKLEQKPGLISSIADALFVVDPVNDLALSYKCKYYNHVGKGYLAKQLYATFTKDYRTIYGEEYKKTYSDILIEETPY